jgi:arabinofuranosyltransferase
LQIAVIQPTVRTLTPPREKGMADQAKDDQRSPILGTISREQNFRITDRLYRACRVVCLFILVAGGTAHIFLGTSGGAIATVGDDDAYISYRYARNLFRGEGLVFNPGERTEGYSNFSYVLLTSLAFFVTGNEGVYFFACFLNLAFACVAFLVFAGFLRERLGNGLAAVGGFLFVLCLPLWAAVGSGMESCLLLLLYIAIWVVV